ncbi:MAG: uracil-DNA glycosylase [Desulfurococcales archaeon]|nr:uracil-DNA glycosylase [Desulfurococcales archaeon]
MEQRLRLYKILVEEIATCTRCRLHESRKNPVPGEGPVPSRIMIVGEAPGRREDEAGRPFVGQAGKLLDKLLSLAGLTRREVYITNVVKCRPPGNRDPRQDEIAACSPYLQRQVQLVEPEIIMAVGRIAGATLYRMAGLRWRGIRAERGRLVHGAIAGRRVGIYPTFHPAAALYNREVLPMLEEDFRRLGEILRGGRGKSLLDFL